MAHYRKRPLEVEAWHWLFKDDQEETPRWLHDALSLAYGTAGSVAFWPVGNHRADADPEWRLRPHMEIVTLGGTMRAEPGDYIVKGIAGELYPCRQDIFESSYEPVAPPSPDRRKRLAALLDQWAEEGGDDELDGLVSALR